MMKKLLAGLNPPVRQGSEPQLVMRGRNCAHGLSHKRAGVYAGPGAAVGPSSQSDRTRPSI
jgi:hypothetical protein